MKIGPVDHEITGLKGINKNILKIKRINASEIYNPFKQAK